MRRTITSLLLVGMCIVAAGVAVMAESLPGRELLAGCFSAASWAIAYSTDLLGCRSEWYVRRGLPVPGSSASSTYPTARPATATAKGQSWSRLAVPSQAA